MGKPHDEDDEDWDGVEVHEHADGSRHAIVNITPRKRTPWWRSPGMYRKFWWELTLVVLYTAWAVASVIVWGISSVTLVMSVALVGLLLSAVFRSIGAYRVGFAMGIAAFPLAMGQKTPKLAAELIERSSELWDPSPAAVSHTMEIERLERDVNRGNAA